MLELLKKWIWKIISGAVGAIQTVLLILRFFSIIDCSWWIAFSPLLIMGLVVLIFSIMKLIFRRKRNE